MSSGPAGGNPVRIGTHGCRSADVTILFSAPPAFCQGEPIGPHVPAARQEGQNYRGDRPTPPAGCGYEGRAALTPPLRAARATPCHEHATTLGLAAASRRPPSLCGKTPPSAPLAGR